MSAFPGVRAAGRRTRSRLAGVAIPLVAMLAVACDGLAPSPSTAPPASPTASLDPAEAYAAIQEWVLENRGLTATRRDQPMLLDEAALRAAIERSFREANPPELIAATELLYRGLGLIPPDGDLESIYIELLSGSVIGYYDDDAKELFLVSQTGSVGPVERFTYAHEFTHELQDQAFGIATLGIDVTDEGDRSLARLALLEGDASLVGLQWAQSNLSPEELLEIIRLGSDPETLALLEHAPAVVRETQSFPYTTGLEFVLGLWATGGWGVVDEAYAGPPASTEQILHPDKYTSGEQPIAVELPEDLATRMGPDWRVSHEDTFGELVLRLWLQDVGDLRLAAATDAAAGWGGDRLAVLEGLDGAWAIALVTAWDSPDDEAAFVDAAFATIDAAGLRGRVATPAGSGRAIVLVASDDATLVRLDRVFGATGV